MTWATNGAFPDQTEFVGSGTLSLNNTAVGDLIALVALSVDSAANYVTSITGGGCTWTQIGTPFVGTVVGSVATTWQGVVTATGAQTATVTVTGGSPTIAICNQEFSSTAGSWSVDGAVAYLDNSGTTTWPTVTPSGSGELAFGFVIDGGIASAGSTPGWTYEVTNHQDGCAWDTNVSAPTAAVWADSGQRFGAVILFKETAAAVASSSSDSGTGTETQYIAVASSDSGTGHDGAPGPRDSGVDSATGSESWSLTAVISSADAASGAEAWSLMAAILGPDSGTGSENQQLRVSSGDFGTGSENQQQSSGTASISDGDIGNGAESQKLVAHVPASDSGTGTEAQSSSQAGVTHVSDSDYGRGQDGDTEGFTGADSASGVDTEDHPVVLAAAVDSAAGADAEMLVIAVKAVASADGGSGSEGWFTAATKAASDAAVGSGSEGLLFYIHDFDSSVASDDDLYLVDVYPFPPPWLQQPGGGYRAVLPEEGAVAVLPPRQLEHAGPSARVEMSAVSELVVCSVSTQISVVMTVEAAR